MYILRVFPSAKKCSSEKPGGIGLGVKDPDFLLYYATTNGGLAYQNLMIPCLIESLRMLSPTDCMSVACMRASGRIDRYTAEHCLPDLCQIPKIELTFRKKFCIGKNFDLNLNDVERQAAGSPPVPQLARREPAKPATVEQTESSSSPPEPQLERREPKTPATVEQTEAAGNQRPFSLKVYHFPSVIRPEHKSAPLQPDASYLLQSCPASRKGE